MKTGAWRLDPASVANAMREACITDVHAFKPGNVSIASPGHGMQAQHFIASAHAIAAVIAAPGMKVGQRILSAIEATRAVVPFNTNLGIVLLCAPLAHAATDAMDSLNLRERLQGVLARLDRDDAETAYHAIRLAAPGGLGRAVRHDVAQPARVSLREAMHEARSRDRIALQYVTDYRDVFETGVPAVRDALARWDSREWAAVHAYLILLAGFADTHIMRKHGPQVAASVSAQALDLSQSLGRARDPAQLMPSLEAFDRKLKAGSINPGTTADLTVAALVATGLEDSLEHISRRTRTAIGASG